MVSEDMTSLKVYELAERLADEIWELVVEWDDTPQETLGVPLVKAADDVGGSIAEGCGRGGFADNRRAIRVARGYLKMTEHFLRRAYQRKLITDKQAAALKSNVDELTLVFDAYLARAGAAKEREREREREPEPKPAPAKERSHRPPRG
jgi:four helix bundle protein